MVCVHVQYCVCVLVCVLIGCIHGLEGEGMPVFRRPDVKGNLYVV